MWVWSSPMNNSTCQASRESLLLHLPKLKWCPSKFGWNIPNSIFAFKLLLSGTACHHEFYLFVVVENSWTCVWFCEVCCSLTCHFIALYHLRASQLTQKDRQAFVNNIGYGHKGWNSDTIKINESFAIDFSGARISPKASTPCCGSIKKKNLWCTDRVLDSWQTSIKTEYLPQRSFSLK